MGFFIALLSGILMSVQGVFNTEVTKQTSLWRTNVLVQFLALLVCLIFWLTTDKGNFMELTKVQPRYLLTGGIIGAFITYTVILSMDRLGPAKAVLFIVVAQITMAYVIEVLGLFGVEKQPFVFRKLIGLMMALLGIVVFKI